MDNDSLVFKKERAISSGWRPITISTEAYLAIKNLADEANLPISKVAVTLIDYALERAVVEK